MGRFGVYDRYELVADLYNYVPGRFGRPDIDTNRTGETQRLVQGFPMLYFFRYEVEHLITRCGFKVVDVFGNYDKSPYTDESSKMIIVAEKLEIPHTLAQSSLSRGGP